MKKYIYNLEQAYFYIENKVRPILPPKLHNKTNHIFFIFNTEETEEVYKLWCEQVPIQNRKRIQ
jgi:hypothetical protein